MRDAREMQAATHTLEIEHTVSREEVFDAAWAAHRHEVYRWALRFTGRPALAEDLTHDVFVKLLERVGRLERAGDLGGWLYRVTANLALSHLRRERSFVRKLGRVLIGDDETTDGPDEGLELKESARDALRMLRSLPPKESMVLTMKVMDGKSQREIADALGMSEGYVSKLITRAWQQVRAAGWEVAHVEA